MVCGAQSNGCNDIERARNFKSMAQLLHCFFNIIVNLNKTMKNARTLHHDHLMYMPFTAFSLRVSQLILIPAEIKKTVSPILGSLNQVRVAYIIIIIF